ncbi:MAG TPA: hypothetical protein VKF82_04970 [Candidatus Eremiobacteraceae bacterium]|nr:hypothetical protein [Candidatus Eremiobacteraceae bacterium]
MRTRIVLATGVAAFALAVAGCNPFQSVQLDLTPNPIVVGLLDTKATIHAHVVTHGFGTVPFDNVQFAVYNANNSLLLSQKEKIDQSGRTTTMDRDYTFPINGAAVALSGTKYIEVRIYDPNGKELAARRLDIVVHALSGLTLPSILMPKDVTPGNAPTAQPLPASDATTLPTTSL